MLKLSSSSLVARDSVIMLNAFLFRTSATNASQAIINGTKRRSPPVNTEFKMLHNKMMILNNNHHVPSIASFSTSASPRANKEWTTILNHAEKLVGYPTSFLSLRYLVSDEMANFANLVRKLVKTKHPLMNMVRRLILTGGENESKKSLQINGLIVLLIAKAAGIPKKSMFLESDISEGILNTQRCLAEITEMIYMGSLIHKGIVDLRTINDPTENLQMDQGNKLAVLCGDYLLASACNNLAKLQNTQVVGLMSEVIADISQSAFVNCPADNSNNSNSSKQQVSFLKIWYESVNSNTSSLLANSAKAAMVLVSHPQWLQDTAWDFAKHLDISHKIWSDIVDVRRGKKSLDTENTIVNAIYRDKYQSKVEHYLGLQKTEQSNLSSASSPSMMSSIYARFSSTEQSVDNELIENVIKDCKSLFNKHYNTALASLDQLDNEHSEKDAISSLKSILHVMKESF